MKIRAMVVLQVDGAGGQGGSPGKRQRDGGGAEGDGAAGEDHLRDEEVVRGEEGEEG